MPTTLNIRLEKETYFSPSLLSGVFCIETSKQLSVREISLIVSGVEKTKQCKTVPSRHARSGHVGNRSHGTRATTKRVTIKEKNEFLHRATFLTIPNHPFDGHTGVALLPPGRYSIPFSFQLPPYLHYSTIHKDKASIRYNVYGNLNVSAGSMQKLFGGNVKSVSQPFRVLGNIYKEQVEISSQPGKFRNSKSFLFSTSSGIISVNGTIPCKMAKLGSSIPLSLSIRNETKRKVSKVKVQLVQEMWIRATNKNYTKESHKQVIMAHCVEEFPDPLRRETKAVTISLPVPIDIFPSLYALNFKRTYKIKMEVVTNGIGPNLFLSLPAFYVFHDPTKLLAQDFNTVHEHLPILEPVPEPLVEELPEIVTTEHNHSSYSVHNLKTPPEPSYEFDYPSFPEYEIPEIALYE